MRSCCSSLRSFTTRYAFDISEYGEYREKKTFLYTVIFLSSNQIKSNYQIIVYCNRNSKKSFTIMQKEEKNFYRLAGAKGSGEAMLV